MSNLPRHGPRFPLPPEQRRQLQLRLPQRDSADRDSGYSYGRADKGTEGAKGRGRCVRIERAGGVGCTLLLLLPGDGNGIREGVGKEGHEVYATTQ